MMPIKDLAHNIIEQRKNCRDVGGDLLCTAMCVIGIDALNGQETNVSGEDDSRLVKRCSVF